MAIKKILTSYRSYGFFGIIELVFFYFKTKILYKKLRLVRFPLYVRGKDLINFGHRNTFGRFNRIEAFPYSQNKKEMIIDFGNDIQVNDSCHFAAISSIKIGNRCLIASKVFISDHDHGDYSSKNLNKIQIKTPPTLRNLSSKPIIIGDDCWIGEGVNILKGTNIGSGCIIGAGSVVKGEFPQNCILAGVPAKIIKVYDSAAGLWIKKK